MIRYANVDGHLREPATGLKGICPGCDSSLIAKCGDIKIHHWAHKQSSDCDRWWEPMTEWHLDWQNEFPKEWREVIFRDEQTGEFHRADVHTSKGLTIEFQNSSLSLQELSSRNAFYKKIIWVVNAERFRGQFEFTNVTPNPTSPLLANYNFYVNVNGFAKDARFMLKDDGRDPRKLGRIYSLLDEELELAADEFYNSEKKYCLFNWKYKHTGWLQSDAPVFLDFGHEFLYWVKKRAQLPIPLLYLQIVSKRDFLAKYT